eukprot:10788396-Alexandrium_andersonii.AAC.1
MRVRQRQSPAVVRLGELLHLGRWQVAQDVHRTWTRARAVEPGVLRITHGGVRSRNTPCNSIFSLGHFRTRARC